MSGDAVAEYLDWDSQFFGLRIARIRTRLADVKSARQALAWCENERIDCAYYLSAADDAIAMALAQEQGFRLVDVRVTLSRNVSAAVPPPVQSSSVRPAVSGDLKALKAIAAVSHGDSRFYADTRFPRTLCGKLYETWIEKSCNGGADGVLVANVAGRAAGYVTCHLRADAEGEIGLVAVDPREQRGGLGRSLVAAAQAFFAEHKSTYYTVSTQGRNIKALRLYESCGFQTTAVALWFHRWFDLRAGAPA